jgi:predicted RNase H-like HicB family nuclease
MNEHYPVRVWWSEDDDGWIAIAPDLPGCSAVGDTREEAVRELQVAIEGWIEAQRAVGNPIPEPSSERLRA